MKTSFISAIAVVALAFCLVSCEKSKTRNINIDLHLDAPLSGESDPTLPKEIVQLLEPVECEGNANAIAKITVHRHDFNPVKTAEIEIPVTGASALRKKLNMLDFEHLKAEYSKNSQSFPNAEILFSVAPPGEGGAALQESALKDKGTFTFICCRETENPQDANFSYAGDFAALIAQIRDSVCTSGGASLTVLYQKSGSIAQPPSDDTPPPPAPASSLEAVFNEIGNKDTDPEQRLSLISEKMSLFAPNAQVKEIGDAGTSSEPYPVAEYLEKIALYRSLDHIEIIEALQNDKGLFWEIRLKEHHSNINR